MFRTFLVVSLCVCWATVVRVSAADGPAARSRGAHSFQFSAPAKSARAVSKAGAQPSEKHAKNAHARREDRELIDT